MLFHFFGQNFDALTLFMEKNPFSAVLSYLLVGKIQHTYSTFGGNAMWVVLDSNQ